ncbi:hypothetical protein SAMN05421666_3521 [Roseovarius nanhaiticus]|uniref:Uncharacterized protein n=1 Tax=Roseovarius nanhaiticus TaxID=573024 RepID=A0A1N7HNK5_9RHOB|nr:hypothetical protein [Roseovarius nanhaiticus]SEL39646.1 hypothetical protein SAMN05216208_0022 [Roseovarius nanhaiticus]SIS26351.1 hypothetical protein SAMN05421666_3521 [Roseovarius nanhaiticus]
MTMPKFSQTIRMLGVSLAVSWAVPQTAGAATLCEGEFISAVTGASPPVQGKVTGVSNPYRKQPVRIDVEDCGRTLVIHGDGAISLKQSANDPAHYVGSHQGAPAVFDIWSPDRLTGQILIPGSNGGVIFEMTLVDGTSPDMGGCGKSALQDGPSNYDRLTVDPVLRSEVIGIIADQLGVPRDQAGRYISALRSVAKTRQSDKGVTEILPGEPGCPIELTGVKTCRVFPPETTTFIEVNLLLDAGGRLLPVTTDGSDTGRVRVDDPGATADLCAAAAPEKEYPAADNMLRFKFLGVEEDGIYDVQAGLLDADMRVFKKAHYAKGTSRGRQGRAEAAEEAYQAIGSPVTGVHNAP